MSDKKEKPQFTDKTTKDELIAEVEKHIDPEGTNPASKAATSFVIDEFERETQKGLAVKEAAKTDNWWDYFDWYEDGDVVSTSKGNKKIEDIQICSEVKTELEKIKKELRQFIPDTEKKIYDARFLSRQYILSPKDFPSMSCDALDTQQKIAKRKLDDETKLPSSIQHISKTEKNKEVAEMQIKAEKEVWERNKKVAQDEYDEAKKSYDKCKTADNESRGLIKRRDELLNLPLCRGKYGGHGWYVNSCDKEVSKDNSISIECLVDLQPFTMSDKVKSKIKNVEHKIEQAQAEDRANWYKKLPTIVKIGLES